MVRFTFITRKNKNNNLRIVANAMFRFVVDTNEPTKNPFVELDKIDVWEKIESLSSDQNGTGATTSENLTDVLKRTNSAQLLDTKNITVISSVPMNLQQEFSRNINIPNVQIQKV